MSSLEQGLAAYEAEDFSAAFEIMMPLAKAGNRDAQAAIAGMYCVGQGVERDITESIKWYRLAAEQGDYISQNNLGTLLLHENPQEAIQWLITAAEKDLPFSQSAVGDIYSGAISLSNGLTEKLRDNTEAVKWYKKAAAQGFPIACHRLGEMYTTGTGVAKDEEQAVQWYRRAAEEDYELSQEVLGEAYQKGLLGLPCDSEQSQYWFARARANKEAG